MRGLKWSVGAAAAAIAVVIAVQAQPASGQGGGVMLAEKFSPGLVRLCESTRQVKVELAQWMDEDYKSISRSETSRQFVAHDWFTQVNGGNPSEVWRSYENITGKEKNQITEDSDPMELDAADLRANNTFIIGIEGGKRTLKNKPLATVDEKLQAQALADIAPRLLPGKAVSTGDKWKVAAENLSLPYGCGLGEIIKQADVSVTLSSVGEKEGSRVAKLAISGTMTTYFEQLNEFDDNASTRITTKWEIAGEAEADVAEGRLLSLNLSNQASATGKLGGMNCSIAGTGRETNLYRYAWVIDKPVENGKEGPESVDDLYTVKHGKLADGHIVIARNNGSIGRIQALDPSTGKIVKTLMALPKDVSVDDLALCAARNKVAFTSTGNSGISITDVNVFTLDTVSGKVDQITPSWTTGDGLAKPLDTGKTATVTGRLVWHDDEFNRDRSDGLNVSAVRVDHTPCFASVDAQGRFTLKNVPVGASLFMYVWALLPNYTNGKSRHMLGNKAIASSVFMLTEEGEKDLGDIRIHTPAIDNGYMNPTFAGDNLWCNYTGSTQLYRVGLGKREWYEAKWAGTEIQSGGLSASADGKMLGMVADGKLRFLDAVAGKEVWSVGVAASVSFDASSAWLSGEAACVVSAGVDGFTGTEHFGTPVLLYANPGKKVVTFARKWPQLNGGTIKAVAMGSDSVVYFVLHTHDLKKNLTYGDLYKWDADTNTTKRVTSLGDVISVAALGR